MLMTSIPRALHVKLYSHIIMPSIHDSPHPVPAPPSHPVASTAAIKPLAAANQTLTSKQIPRVCPTLKPPSIGSPSPCAPSASGTPPATITRRNSRSRTEKTPLRAHCGRKPRQRVGAPQKPQLWTDFCAFFCPPASWRELKQVVQVAMRHGGLRCDRGAKAEAPRARTTRKGETGRRSEALRGTRGDEERASRPQDPLVFLSMDPKTPRSWWPRLHSISRRLPPIRSCPLGLPPAGANPSC